MSLIKKLLDSTTLSTDICNIIMLKVYKSNYNNCIEEYSIKLYGENKVYYCDYCYKSIKKWETLNVSIINKLKVSRTCIRCYKNYLIEGYNIHGIDAIECKISVNNNKLFGIKLPFGITNEVIRKYNINKGDISRFKYWWWQ